MNDVEIAHKLIDHGYQCFLVGGAIRDRFAGVKPKDFDLATNAHPNEILDLFKNDNAKDIGKSFPVIMVDGIEVATFRKERSKGIGDKNTEIEYSDSIYEDIKRRDFTINSMAINLEDNFFIDDFGGQIDLENKIMKFVGNPEERIFEDPNRIIRACRFLAKIEGSFDKKTFEALKKYSFFVKNYVDPERIRKEILKAMELQYASLFFDALKSIDALKYIFPNLNKCGEDHGIYHTETIFEHNMVTGDSISTKDPILKLTGYLHDIGKPIAHRVNYGKNFSKHGIYGSIILKKELKALKFSNEEIDTIAGLTRCHMYSLKNITHKATRRLLKKLDDNKVEINSFLRLKIADRKGNIAKECHSIGEIKKYVRTLKNPDNKNLPFSAHDLALSGGEIKELFNVHGKEIGLIQKILLQYVLEYGSDYNNKIILSSIVQSEYFGEDIDWAFINKKLGGQHVNRS